MQKIAAAVVTGLLGAAQIVIGDFYRRQVDAYSSLALFQLSVDSQAVQPASWRHSCELRNVGFSAALPPFTLRVAYPARVATEPPAPIAAEVLVSQGVQLRTAPARRGYYIDVVVDSGMAPAQRLKVLARSPVPANHEFHCSISGDALRDVRSTPTPVGFAALGALSRHAHVVLWVLGPVFIVATVVILRRPSGASFPRLR